MLRFDDVLTLKNPGAVAEDAEHAGGKVVLDAKGPLDQAEEEMIELCAWVFQRGEHDAAATEMTTGTDHHTAGGTHLDIITEDGQDKWKLPLRQVGDEPLEAGEAFGVAVAMMRVKSEGDQQRVIWWGHPITLE